MRPKDYSDTAELITRRVVVEAQVHALFQRFLETKRPEIGEGSFAHLSAVAATDLLGVQSELRQVLVRVAAERPTDFQSAPYWEMVDAIGFVADSIKGRWPYMGPTERDNSLTNAVNTVANVDRLLSGGVVVAQPKTLYDYTEADEVADSVTHGERERG